MGHSHRRPWRRSSDVTLKPPLRSTSSIKGRLVLRTSLISSALGAHAKRTTGGKTGRGEPGSTVQLRNVFGTPASAMKGLKDHAVQAPWQERESVYYTPYGTPFTIPLRCCMCFELSDGVVWIALFQLLVYSILSIFLTNIVIVGVDKVGIDPVIFGVDSKIVAVGLLIFSLIVAIPMNIIGIVGAIQRRKNFVFAYRCAVTPIYAIFMAVTVTVFQETCIELNCTNAQLGVINCLYLRISIENAGHGMPSFVAPRCTDTLG